MMKTIKGRDIYFADFALVIDENDTLIMKPYEKLSGHFKREVKKSGYGPNTYENRPLLHRVFKECHMILDMTGMKTPQYYDRLEHLFRVKLQDERNMIMVVILSFAGAKMGSKTYPTHFVASKKNGHTIHNFYKEKGIFDVMMKLSAAKRLERDKKFLIDYVEFTVKPTITMIPDIPLLDGVVFADKFWMWRNGLTEGVKMAGPHKSMMYAKPSCMVDIPGDLLIMPSEDKLNMGVAAADIAGHAPSLHAEKIFSPNLNILTKKGDLIEGRDPHFGIDVQATLGLTPDPDFMDIRFLLNEIWTDEIIDKYLTYLDAEGNLVLNHLGQEILENGKTMTDPETKYEIHKICKGIVLRELRIRVKGWFGVAKPMSLAEPAVKEATEPHVVIAYSGGIPVIMDCVVHGNVIYVDEVAWKIDGRDFDRDLIFVFKLKGFKNLHNVNELEIVRENYILPVKPKVEDTRDDITTLIDIMKQSRLCGTAYNEGKIFIDACRTYGIPEDKIRKLEIRVMARVEYNIYAFKNIVMNNATVKAAELADYYEVPEVKKYIPNSRKYLMAIKSSTTMMIDDRVYDSFEHLVLRAEEASPDSKSPSERLCAMMKGLVPVRSRMEQIIEDEPMEKEEPKHKFYEGKPGSVFMNHGGKTDQCGGHNDKVNGGYHCHTGPVKGQSFETKEGALNQIEKEKQI